MTKISIGLIYKLFRKKGYHYGSSITNSVDNDIWLEFSTGNNGRGQSVEIRLGDVYNDIEYWFPYGNIKHTNITNVDLIDFIKKDIKNA